MIIQAKNPETTTYEKSYLTDPFSEDATSITVKDNDRFAANDRIMIGAMGADKTEIVTVSAANADGITLTVGATVFPHNADDPVFVLQFDQVKFYRSTTGLSGTYAALATVDLDVDNATLRTFYDDPTGLSTYYYKVSFYHSVDAVESSLSDPIPGGGWSRKQVGHLIDEILQEVSDPGEVNITRGELLGYFNDVNDDLLVNPSRPYDFLRQRETFTRTAGEITLDFPTDSNDRQTMWKFDRMDYLYTDTNNNETMTTIQVLPEEEFRNKYPKITVDTADEDDNAPVAIALDTSMNRFRYWQPSENTIADAFYLHYWKYFDEIDSEGDEVETPTPKIYKLYAKGMYYRKRGVTESSYNQTADRWFAEYQTEKSKLSQLNRKDKGTPRGFQPPNSTINSFRRP